MENCLHLLNLHGRKEFIIILLQIFIFRILHNKNEGISLARVAHAYNPIYLGS
jgi:hypothetical protein